MKTAELREMNGGELEHKIAQLRRQLLEVRFQSAANQLKNPLKRRETRREIARVLTIMKEKSDGTKK